ncbi:unnamed protein product [Alopecurus aequalis]
MAQLLHHQDSAFYGKEMQGRRWSFLQFLGLRRRPWSMKMLSDKKHGHEKGTGESGRRGCYAPLKDEDRGVTVDHESTQVINKHKGSKKTSGKAGLRSFISRKLYGKEGQKEKMLPVAPRLLRTLSIHYLESNVYVFDGEAASDVHGSSDGAKSSQQNATLDGSGTEFSQLQSTGDEHVKRKSHRSISMDGILHKVPYGQKISGDTIIEELPRSASATYDRDCLKPYSGTTARRHVNQGFRRSRSLSESLESYSHLLDSISSSEAKRVLTSSKSTREHSNSQLRSKGLPRFAEYLVIPEDDLASHASDKIVVDGDIKFSVDESTCNEDAGGSENPVLLEEYSSDEKCDVVASTEADLSVTTLLGSEVADISEQHTAAASDDDQVLPSTKVNPCTDPSRSDSDIPEEHEPALVPSQDIGIAEEDTIPSDDQIRSCTAQPSQDTRVAEEHPMICKDNNIQSFEDVTFSEKPASSEFHKMLDDSSSLEENIVHSNEAQDSVGDDDLDSNNYVKQDDKFSDLNDLQLQAADPEKEAVLAYVKDIFTRSSFATEPLFDAWRWQNIAKLQKEYCQHNELSFSADLAIADMSADEFLLYDLTNEALLDMYRRYAAHDSKQPQKPVGPRAFNELWGRVSSQLDQAGVDVDGILSSDLAKADRWVEFRRDGDEVADKLADFVLDMLITELTLQLVKF